MRDQYLRTLESKRFLLHEVAVSGEAYIPFDIRLPAHIRKVTGCMVTNTAWEADTDSIGKLNLMSQDEADLFLSMEISGDNHVENMYGQYSIEVLDESMQKPWTGLVTPFVLPLCVSGDTAVVSGFLENHYTAQAYTLKIYLVYEPVEELTEA